MMSMLLSVLLTLRTWAHSRAVLQLEILALRHQLQVLQRTRPRRVRLGKTDRCLWSLLSRLWTVWRTALVIDRYRLAPTRLPAVVDLEEPSPHGATHRVGGHPHADSHDGAG
jgi:hypothetical protein